MILKGSRYKNDKHEVIIQDPDAYFGPLYDNKPYSLTNFELTEDDYEWVKWGPYKIMKDVDPKKLPDYLVPSFMHRNLEWWESQERKFEELDMAIRYFKWLAETITDLDSYELKILRGLTK
jgi:hypothetical protein